MFYPKLMNNPLVKNKSTIDDLIEVMRVLRDPESGCPWDLEQDFKTIAPYTLEEAYEVADAIDRGDMDDLREELGDLLFQSIYHAQMAAEAKAFDIHDVIEDITQKMISRHPHVFGNVDAKSAADVDKIWDQKKAEEKKVASSSALDGVTKALPALLYAQKLTKKAAKTGFEWPELSQVLDKLEEEITEMRSAIETGDLKNQEEELGDILFVLANFARMQGINPEEALRQCCNKFERRFKGMEEEFKASDTGNLETASLDQMTQMWNKQKRKERE